MIVRKVKAYKKYDKEFKTAKFFIHISRVPLRITIGLDWNNLSDNSRRSTVLACASLPKVTKPPVSRTRFQDLLEVVKRVDIPKVINDLVELSILPNRYKKDFSQLTDEIINNITNTEGYNINHKSIKVVKEMKWMRQPTFEKYKKSKSVKLTI